MGGTRKLPYAFTEQGIYMLMTVLKGNLATKQSILIVDDYIEIAIGEAFSKTSCKSLIANGWDYTIERREVLKFLGFKE